MRSSPAGTYILQEPDGFCWAYVPTILAHSIAVRIYGRPITALKVRGLDKGELRYLRDRVLSHITL